MATKVKPPTVTPEEHYQHMVTLGIEEAEAKAIAGLVSGEWVSASKRPPPPPLTPEELAMYED